MQQNFEIFRAFNKVSGSIVNKLEINLLGNKSLWEIYYWQHCRCGGAFVICDPPAKSFEGLRLIAGSHFSQACSLLYKHMHKN